METLYKWNNTVAKGEIAYYDKCLFTTMFSKFDFCRDANTRLNVVKGLRWQHYDLFALFRIVLSAVPVATSYTGLYVQSDAEYWLRKIDIKGDKSSIL